MFFGRRKLLLQSFTVILAAVTMTVVFWLPLWKGGSIVGGDSLTYFFPQKTYLANQLAEGNLPLWNNLSGHGYPVIAESQTGLCYPPTLLFYWLLDVNTAYNTNLILHYVLAFVFTWMYARRIKLDKWGAGLTAVVFTYGWFAPRFHFEWSFLTGAWLPLVFWSAESFLQTGRRKYLLLLSIAVAVQLLAGHFALAFITLVGLVSYVSLRHWFRGGLSDETSTVANSSQQTKPVSSLPNFGRTILPFAVALLLGFALAAVQLVPTWELKQQSHRGTEVPYHDITYGRIPPIYLLQLVAPWYFYSSDYDINRSAKPDAPETNKVEAHLYLGLIPLLLVIVGLFQGKLKEHRQLWPWAILGIVAMVVTTGWFSPLFRMLPGFSYFGGPGRYSILTTMAGALMAGMMLDTILKSMVLRRRVVILVIVFSTTIIDLHFVSRAVSFASFLPVSLMEYRDQCLFKQEFDKYDGVVRVFTPGQNLLTMIGVSATPNFLGLSPVAYFDPETRFPEIFSFNFNSPPVAPTSDQVEWLQRAGVTHLLTFAPINEKLWPVHFPRQGIDPFLNRAWNTLEPLYICELNETRGRLSWTKPDRNKTARIVEYDADRVVAEAESPAGGRLVLTDLAYPGWRVFVDGESAESITVEQMYRAVDLSAGKHKIVWEYRPLSVYVGATISVTAFVVLVLLTCWFWRRS